MIRRGLQADFDRGHRTLAEMTPAPTWWQRCGWVLLTLSAVAGVTGAAVIVMLPAMLLWELAVGR